MQKIRNDWESGMRHRLGLATLSFTPGRIRQTLHVPCYKGSHIVDVTIGAHQHPDQVAKRMLRDGWTIGSKMACPEHNRRRPVVAVDEPVAVEPARRLTQQERSRKGAAARWADKTPEQKSQHARMMAEARQRKKEGGVMENVVKLPEVKPTPNAAKAMRALYEALDSHYDEAGKRYKEGHSDQSIAKAVGLSVDKVKETREGAYGPLGPLPEVVAFLDDIKSLRALIAENGEGLRTELRKLEVRLEVIIRKHAG